jgi:RNA polymerase sigma-70 factor, ECF subfamily
VPSELDFAEFYAASFRSLVVQLHAFTGDHAEAQDLAQEAFFRAYARWSAVSRYDDPLGWVRKVAWNLAISRWRRARRLVVRQRDLAPVPVAGPNGTQVDLVRALRTLPPHHRQAVVLHYLGDLSVREIAEFTGAAEGTVKAWLHRGRTALGPLLGTSDEEAANV